MRFDSEKNYKKSTIKLQTITGLKVYGNFSLQQTREYLFYEYYLGQALIFPACFSRKWTVKKKEKKKCTQKEAILHVSDD